MNTGISSRRSLIILLLITAVLSLVPVWQTLQKTDYTGIPPAYIDDDIYYYGRMREVVDGKPLIGNPYFFEHRDAGSITFSITDWIAAVPLAIGAPFSVAIAANFLCWSLIFVYLAYRLTSSFTTSPLFAGAISLIAYLETYWLIMRPVIMQQVFPFFFLFILALTYWLRNPQRRESMIALAIAGATTFYVYGFLWQIACTVVGLIFLTLLISRRWSDVKTLFSICFGMILGAVPAIIYALKQMSAPVYWETFGRIGLLRSHLPTLDAYRYGRWAVALVALFVLAQYWLKRDVESEAEKLNAEVQAALYLGLGLLTVSLSNIVTGTDIATGQHVGRFITLYVALYLPLFLSWAWKRKVRILKLARWKIVILGFFVLVCVGFLASNLRRSLPFDHISATNADRIQGYARPLAWLEAREREPIVVWTDDEMSTYVPILTKHYVFWNYLGALHIVPTAEVEERFLASRMSELTADNLFAAIERIKGSGVGRRYEDSLNKNRLRCALGAACEVEVSMREWLGEHQLSSLLQRRSALRRQLPDLMNKYGVSYLIADSEKPGENDFLRQLPHAKPVWSDNRFIIYAIE